MRNIKRQIKNVFIFIIIFISTTGFSDNNKVIVNFKIGDIKTKRNGKFIFLQQGDIVLKNDIFKLSKKSIIEFRLKTVDKKIKITGPKIFRFKREILTGNKSSILINNLLKLLSKNSPPYVPRTIVSAVRGKNNYHEKKEQNRSGKKKIKKAIKLISEKKLDEAWNILDELDKIGGLKKHAKVLIQYYRGEILFEKMDFSEALTYYIEAHKYRAGKFKHREESHVRAIICADLERKFVLKNELIKEYNNNYGNHGKYRKIINHLK